MIALIGAKMVTDWNRPRPQDQQDVAGAFSASLGGLVSMFLALVGGLICQGAAGGEARQLGGGTGATAT